MDDDNNNSSDHNDGGSNAIIDNNDSDAIIDNNNDNDIIDNDNTNNDVMDTNDTDNNDDNNNNDNNDNTGKRKRDDDNDDDDGKDGDIFGNDDDDDDDDDVKDDIGNYSDDDDENDAGVTKKKIKQKKKKSKISGKEYFDMEANEEDSENEKKGGNNDSDDDEDEDEDDYEFDDGFVVRDAEDSVNEDSNDETQKKEKKTLKRLKKQKASSMLDEDDLLLIQDNAGDADEAHQQKDDDKSEEEETEIVAQRIRDNRRDDDEDSDLGGFIIDDDDVGSEIQRFKQAKVPFSAEEENYEDNERLKDAEDIFGVGFDELEFEDDFDDDKEDNLEASAAAKSAQAKEALRAKYDRITLVENFCTDSDESIRQTDLPERMQSYFKFLTDRSDDERKIEASWIAQKLCEKTNINLMESSSYENAIEKVLTYLQVDHFEVPFIWAYRKPSLENKLSRKNLWYIFYMDEKWERIKALKGKILKFIETITEAASADLDDTDLFDIRDKLRREVKSAELNVDEEMERERNEENENYDLDRSQLDEAIESLKELKTQLQEIEGKIDAARRRKAVHLVYDKTGAENVLRLFHTDRYVSQIEYTNDEIYLKDILKYLDMLVKGAETKTKIENDDDEKDEFDDDDEDDKVKSLSTLRISGRRTIASGKDLYRKYCRIERLREYAEYFVIPISEFGDSMRHGFKSEPPPTPPQTAIELASQFVDGIVLKNENAVLRAVTVIIASELSAEPSVRDAIRAQYKRNIFISTRPTPKGLTVITPFSPLFGIHYLNLKPLHEFLEKDKTLFIRLTDAEKNGLITISFETPKLQDGSNDLKAVMVHSNFIPNFSLTLPPETDPYPDARESWDNLRLEIVKCCIEEYLLPSLQEEFKRELMREGREALIEEAAANFAQMLSYGPYKDTENPIEAMKSLLRNCPDRPDRTSIASIYMPSSDRDAVYFALVDKDGLLKAHEICPGSISNQKREKITDWLVKHRPSVVVLNSSAGQSSKSMAKLIDEQICRDVETQIRLKARQKREKREIDNDYGRHIDEDDEFIDYKTKTVIVNDELAKIFRVSKRSKKMFPELDSGFHAAVCLARLAREPLAEYCNIWTSSNASEVFGYEALYLDVHPQKHLLDGVRRQLLNALEQVLVDAVCDVGVDVNLAASNDHLYSMLAFVSGLGLRKADNLRQSIRRSKMVTSRNELIKRKLLTATIWTNATGFLYIRDSLNQDKLNLLDNTRIHPECYTQFEIVQKICANALDIDSWGADDVNDIVERQMHASRRELENKMKKHPEWINLWLEGRPIIGVTPYKERSRDKETGHEKFIEKSCELKDGMAMLILEDYIADLSDLQEKELWANAPQIKEEIRYPCLDLRQSCRTPSNEEMFKIITGETDHSLYIGQKVGVEILEIKDVYNRNNNTTRRLAQCKTDSNIRGTISEYEIVDDKIDPVRFNMKDHLQEGMSVMAVIIGVQKDRFSVDLSIKPSYLKKTEDWWLANRYDFRGSEYSSMPKSCLKWWRDTGKNPEKLFDLYFEEKEALKEYLKKEQAESKKYESSTTSTSTTTKTTNKSRQPYRRAIQHPLFKNIDFKDAEEFLRAGGKGAGEVIIRPSSKGLDRLAITWAFQENMFKHIDVEERGKQEGNIGLGTELRIKEEDMRDEIYSDLDEIFSRYVMAMNDFVNTAVANRRFFDGQVLEGEEYLKTQAANNPTTIPYILRLEPNKAGYFCLSWLIKESSNPIKKELIQVRPSGYMYRKVVYPSLSEVFSRFKADQSALRSGQMPQPSSRQNPAQGQRKSRFTSNKEQGYAIPPPPPPMQVQAYPMQGGYQDTYYNNNYQMPPPPMHY